MLVCAKRSKNVICSEYHERLDPDVFPYLLVLNAMEHKDKQPLQTIQYGEDVRHHN